MTLDEKKNAYAALIVKAGGRVRPGQKVFLRCPVECYEFGRLVARKAYEAGASEVDTEWQDLYLSRMRPDYAPMEVFTHCPEWTALKLNTYAQSDVVFISLRGADPEIFKGVDPAKQAAEMRAMHEPLKVYHKMLTTMGFKWTIAGVPTTGWARKVYPMINEQVAVTRLWDAIFETVRIGDGDAYGKWMAHAENLAGRCAAMTAWQFKTLRYESANGTDFTVGLAEHHRFEGGADRDPADGGPFFANMPTEEVFTMPDCRVAEGTLVASMPLSWQGCLIEDFRLVFHEGAVVDYDARRGKETLRRLLESDEGSRRLGECALVPYPSPVSAQGILFYNTLFDENAACHFALGQCYETNIEGGPEMTEEELKAHGGNVSMNHVDFMVGTADLKITGTRADGEEVVVFRHGTWAF